MKTYSPWLEPVTTDFYGLTWREAEAFLKKFVHRIPERIFSLEGYIRSTRGFEAWRADRSEQSFRELGPWLLKVLERRELKRDEKQFVQGNPSLSPEMVDLLDESVKNTPMWEFVPESDAVLVDVGMYLADCLHCAFPTTKWIRCKAKCNHWFNFPLLGMRTNYGFNPIIVPNNAASVMFDGGSDADEFLRLYRVAHRNAALTEQHRVAWARAK